MYSKLNIYSLSLKGYGNSHCISNTHRQREESTKSLTQIYLLCRLTLTKVAVSRQRHKVGVEDMLVPDLIRPIIIDAHLKQGVVLLFHSYNACSREKSTKQQMDEKK